MHGCKTFTVNLLADLEVLQRSLCGCDPITPYNGLNVMKELFFSLLVAISLANSAFASEDTAVPNADAAGLSDPTDLKRIAGSLLFVRDDVAYDEINALIEPLWCNTDGCNKPKVATGAGQRTRLMYVTPPGTSALAALRSYQQDLAASGYKTIFECDGEKSSTQEGKPCEQMDYLSSTGASQLDAIFPKTSWTFSDSSQPSCAAGGTIKDARYSVLQNAEGALVALATFSPDVNSVYCDQAAYKDRVFVALSRVQPKARVQNMVAVSASEMQKSMDSTGRVALYGIFFDTGSSVIKPESNTALAEIAKLLNTNPALKLHVVGHTDNQGSLDSNFALSKARAQAVSVALSQNYAIAAARLNANGVSSLAPVASNTDEAGRAKNRRVELVPF